MSTFYFTYLWIGFERSIFTNVTFLKNTFVIPLLLHIQIMFKSNVPKQKYLVKLHSGQKVEKDPILKIPLCLS